MGRSPEAGGNWDYQGQLLVRAKHVGMLDNVAYVVACPETLDAVLVDAPEEPEVLAAALEGVRLVAVLETHGDADHLQALGALCRRFPQAWVGVHPADLPMFPPPSPERRLEDGQEVAFGRCRLRVLHTPGHTPGSVCLLGGGMLFSGDTLFPGGPGATSSPRSDFDTIIESIRSRLLPLPDDTLVLPGHGLPTTLGAESPHFEEWVRRRW